MLILLLSYDKSTISRVEPLSLLVLYHHQHHLPPIPSATPPSSLRGVRQNFQIPFANLWVGWAGCAERPLSPLLIQNRSIETGQDGNKTRVSRTVFGCATTGVHIAAVVTLAVYICMYRSGGQVPVALSALATAVPHIASTRADYSSTR